MNKLVIKIGLLSCLLFANVTYGQITFDAYKNPIVFCRT
ncbi:uncharacterized protein METZ01_LOCUS457444, partial [marine metagenome]